MSSERQTDRIDLKHLVDLVKANTGKKGFTYTHYDVLEDGFTGDHNRNAIRNANTRGFTINLSADSFDEADKMVELGIAPVTVLLPSEVHGKTCTTPSGNKVITCPAAMKDNISCETCALCYRTKRPFIIGFPAHGAKKSTVDRFLSVLEEADAISNIGISAT